MGTDASLIRATTPSARYVSRMNIQFPEGPLQPPVMAVPPTLALSGPNGNGPITTPTVVFSTDQRVTHRGAVNTSNPSGWLVNILNGNWTWPASWDEFDYYGSDFAFKWRTPTADSYIWVWVDGQPATANPVLYSTLAPNAFYWLRVTFGAGVAQRRIRIYRYLADYGGLVINSADAVSPVPGRLTRIAVLGDSWTEGTAATYSGLTGFAQTIGRLIGAEIFQAGQGSTGYVATPGGARTIYNDPSRLNPIQTANPDILIVEGSQNDTGQAGATIQAAATALYAQVATQMPNTKIIVVGPATPGTITGPTTTNRNALLAAANAAPNVLGFIDPLNDAQGLQWIIGTGNVGAPNGTGNADSFVMPDNAHLNQAGHNYYARRLAQYVLTMLGPQL